MEHNQEVRRARIPEFQPVEGADMPGRKKNPKSNLERSDQSKADAHDHDKFLAMLPPDVAEAFRTMRSKYGPALPRALQDPEIAMSFVRDPVSTLRRVGIDVPPEIARYAARMRQPMGPPSFSYQLPNGQIMRARVQVTFKYGDR